MWRVTVGEIDPFIVPGEASLLDEARSAGHILEFSCRTGRCGVCRAKLLEGEVVALQPQISLSEEEQREGFFLTCCCKVASNCGVEAEVFDELQSIAIKTLPCRIDDLVSLAPGILQVWLRIPPKADLNSVAGQYVDIVGPGRVRRSYSIANYRAPGDRIELHIRQIAGGIMSGYWFDEARKNDLLRLEGPFGTFIPRRMDAIKSKDIVFLATGTGFAPIRAMLDYMKSIPNLFESNRVWLFWGGRVASDIYFDIKSSENFRFEPVLTAGVVGKKRYVQDAALERLASFDNAIFYACGSDAMIKSARSTLIAKGLSTKQFFYEAFVNSNH